MLAKAAQRRVYDELVEADLMTFLNETPERFNLILAADTLVYLGNLEEFFRAAALATPAGAILAFNIETTTKASYIVLPSGRFAHDLTALPGMAAPWFEIVAQRRAILRSEANGKVEGALVLMTAPHIRPTDYALRCPAVHSGRVSAIKVRSLRRPSGPR